MKPSLAPIIGYIAFMSRIPMEKNTTFNADNVIAPKPSLYGHGKNKWLIDGIEVIAKSKLEAQWKANQFWHRNYKN